MDFPKFSDGIR